MNKEVNLHEGLIYIMVTMSAVDSSMDDVELERIGRLVKFLPVFEQFDENDILSTEVREDESEELQHYHYKYWLDNIRHFAPDSPILIVQNKVDKDQRQRISTTWIDEYNIFGDHHISLHEAVKTGTSKYKWSFDTFCNDLSECFDQILKRKAEQKRSIAWLKIRDAVVEVSKAKRKNSGNFN